MATSLSGLSAVDDGYLRLYSSFEPGLVAGDYHIEVEQEFATATQSLSLANSKKALVTTKEFTVVEPALVLRSEDIHSIYPPDAQSEHCDVLPHIVLTNPNLPWEKSVGVDTATGQEGKVPWLALLVFPQAELQFLPDQLDPSKGGLFAGISVNTPLSQSKTGSITLQARSLKALQKAAKIQLGPLTGISDDGAVTSIFLKRDRLTSMFGTTDSTNQGYHATSGGKPDLSRYQYLAHVRHVSTPGSAMTDKEGLFSCVVAHQTGPWDAKDAVNMSVHLVSLDIKGIDITNGPDTVALSSLYSWNYNCVPSTQRTIQSMLKPLASSVGPLRLPPLSSPQAPAGSAHTWLNQRLDEGYTLIRWTPQTGEQTAAMLHGPLTPARMAQQGIPASNNGTDLHVLDRRAGLLDLTYGAAWSLGRSLALADSSFTPSLLQLREYLKTTAMNLAKIAVDPYYISKEELAVRTISLKDELLKHIRDDSLNSASSYQRWISSHPAADAGISRHERVSWNNVALQEQYGSKLKEVGKQVASAQRADGQQSIYDGSGKPFNSDWAVIVKKLLEILQLAPVPATYLLPDDLCLPAESIRTFYVDDNWTDALIDGILSIGNHYDQEDLTRDVIKECFNEFLGMQQQNVARWGILVKSHLVAAYPDLKVEICCTSQNRPRFVAIRRMADDTLMYLFDRIPEDKAFEGGIRICQPPHQQRFALSTLDAATVGVELRSVFYSAGASSQHKVKEKSFRRGDQLSIYDWDQRSLLFPAFAQCCVSNEVKSLMLAEDVGKLRVSSSLIAYQLNDSLFRLHIGTKQMAADGLVDTPPRQLYRQALPVRSRPLLASDSQSLNLPHVDVPQSNFKRVATGGQGLGGAIWMTMEDDYWRIVWPLQTHRAAIPANWPSPIDLVFFTEAKKDALPITKLVVEIPVGTGANSLFSGTLNTESSTTSQRFVPSIRMLDSAKRWVATGAYNPSMDKFIVTIVPRVPGLVTKNLSFLLGSVHGITAANDTSWFAYEYTADSANPTTRWMIARKTLPSGSWPYARR